MHIFSSYTKIFLYSKQNLDENQIVSAFSPKNVNFNSELTMTKADHFLFKI